MADTLGMMGQVWSVLRSERCKAAARRSDMDIVEAESTSALCQSQ